MLLPRSPEAPTFGYIASSELPRRLDPNAALSLEKILPSPFLASRAFRGVDQLAPHQLSTLAAQHINYWIANPFEGSEFVAASNHLKANLSNDRWIPALLRGRYEATLYLTNPPYGREQVLLAHVFSQLHSDGNTAENRMFNIWIHPDYRQRGVAEAVLRRFVRDSFLERGATSVKLGNDNDPTVARIHRKICDNPNGLPCIAGPKGQLLRAG